MSENKDSITLTEALVDQIKIVKKALHTNATNVISEMTKEDEESDSEEFSTDEVTVDSEDENGEDAEMDTDNTEDSVEGGENELELDGNAETEDELELDGEFDLTDASEDEILTVYKKLTDDDEIEVIDNGDSLELDVKTPGEYIIKDNGKSDSEEDNSELDITNDFNDSEDTDEIEYEIDESELEEVLNEILNEKEIVDVDDLTKEVDEVNEEEEVVSDEEVESEEVVDEKMSNAMADRHAQQVRPNTIKPLGRSLSESVEKSVYDDLKNRYDSIMNEKKAMLGAVTELKTLLHEVMLTNANLAYFSKLVTENVTSKDEKKLMLERFDSVSTVKESKELFLTISNEIKSSNAKKINITESSDKLTSSYSGTIRENVSYVNPEISKMINMMEELDKRK
jgi:hypothetical protein